MYFVPDYTLNLITDQDYPAKMAEVSLQLEKVKHSGIFNSHDSKPLYYEYFLAQGSKGSIVIVHGLSEFTKKYYELAYYFLNQGYNVFVYDQRCHGYSVRLTDDQNLIHVKSFDDYAKDLACFISGIVKPADDKPIYILSHSMGGAVTALYLAKHTDTVSKAVLSSPLIEPTTPVHPILARLWVNSTALLRGSRTRFKLSHDFNPEATHHNSPDASKARFEYNLKLRIDEPKYQTSPTTLGWIKNSLYIKRKLLSRRVTDKIKTPVLLFSAQQDTVVTLAPQHKFASRCKSCTMEQFSGVRHTMFTAENDILSKYVNRVLEFFDT